MKFVPNAITIARIVMTPVLLVMLLSGSLLGQGGALMLFILAAVTDYLDGKLARTLNVRSRLGQFLDPFADKVLVLGTFGVLSHMVPHIVPLWAVVLIAVRDIVITVLRMWMESKGHTLRTIPMAKTKTTLQLVFLIGMLALLALRHIPGLPAETAQWVLDSPIPFGLLLVVVVLTVFTGGWYLMNKEKDAPTPAK